MKTTIFKNYQIKEAADEIKAGNLVSFPTETVYGLGADATNEEAVAKVFKAKGRPADNPLIVHIKNQKQVAQYAQPFDEKTQKLMDTFWPGPLTIILKLKPNVLPKNVTAGLSTAAFRNPKNAVTLSLIDKAGVPLVGPSANTSGKPSPTLAQHVYHDLNGKIAGVVDDGPTDYGVESTVIDMSAEKPAILRPGAVSVDQIEKVIGEVDDSSHHVNDDQAPKAPGMKYTHYSPDANVILVDEPDDWKRVLKQIKDNKKTAGVMATDEVLNKFEWPNTVQKFSLGSGVRTASHLLFKGLRSFDGKVPTIYLQAFAPAGLGEAYMNRASKSAGQNHFK